MEISYSDRYACPSCQGERSLAYFDNSHDDKPVSSYCFKCEEVNHDALSDSPDVKITHMKQSKHDGVIDMIRSDFHIKAIPDRGISEKTARYFGIRVGLSEENGVDITHHYYPRELDGTLQGWHVKVTDPKRFYNLLSTAEERSDGSLVRNRDGDFYGTSKALRANSFILVITEGPTDMATGFEMLVNSRKGRKNEGEPVAIVSTLDGVSSLVGGLVRQRDFVERFKSVVLCMDQDEPGREATAKAAQLMQSWNVEVKVARFSEKDPGEMYSNGKQKEFCEAILFNASRPRPKGSVSKARMMKAASKKAKMGLPLPYPQLNAKVYGIQKRVVMGIGSGVGVGKCCGAADTLVTSDGNILRHDQVEVGHKLAGPYGNNTVVSVTSGHGPMYKVTTVKGDTFTCNGDHVLSTKNSCTRYGVIGDVHNISVKDYINKGQRWRSNHKAWKSGYDLPQVDVPIDPYLLGAWLGDGSTSCSRITVAWNATEVMDYIDTLGYDTSVSAYRNNTGSFAYNVKSGFIGQLRDSALLGNKHIPDVYIRNSKSVRVNVLAGLLDTDGHLVHNCYEFSSELDTLADGVERLATSCGLMVTRRMKSVKGKQYHRLFISGDTDMIPCRVEYKRSKTRVQKKDALVSGFNVEPIGEGEYFGFELDGDHLYILENGIVTHNSTFMTDTINALVDADHNPGVFYFEESTDDTMLMLAIPKMRVDLLDPKAKFDQNKLVGVLDHMSDRIQLASEDIREWRDVHELILEWVLAHNLNPIILDPISNITPSNPSEANEWLNTALGDLTHIAKMHDIGCVVTSHLNAPKNGPLHEEGGRVQEGQFTGSAAMRRWCKVILGIERNKQADGQVPKSPKIDEMLYQPGVSCIRVLKNRVGRWTGPLYYEYSHKTFGYKEM